MAILGGLGSLSTKGKMVAFSLTLSFAKRFLNGGDTTPSNGANIKPNSPQPVERKGTKDFYSRK